MDNGGQLMTLVTSIFPMPVQAEPVAYDPSIVADFRFHPVYGLRDLSGRSNAEWDVHLPSTGGKTYDRFGLLCSAGADVPRLTGDGALVEGQSTNLLSYSDDLARANINTNSGTTVDTVSRLSSAPSYVGFIGSKTSATIKPLTFSVLVQRVDSDFCAIRLQGTYPNRADVCFDLVDGTISKAAVAYGTFLTPSATIDRIGDWYKLTVSAQSDNASSCIGFLSPTTVSQFLDASGSGGMASVRAKHLQIEESAFATSYVPTNGTAVTRSSEHATADGSNGYSLLLSDINPVAAAALRGERACTIAAMVKMGAAHPGINVPLLSDATTMWRGMYFGIAGAFNLIGDTATASINRTPLSANETVLFGGVYSSAGAAKVFVSQPNNTISMSASTSVGSHSIMTRIGLCVGNVAVPMSFSRLRVYDRELSQAELQALYSQWMQGVM